MKDPEKRDAIELISGERTDENGKTEKFWALVLVPHKNIEAFRTTYQSPEATSGGKIDLSQYVSAVLKSGKGSKSPMPAEFDEIKRDYPNYNDLRDVPSAPFTEVPNPQ